MRYLPLVLLACENTSPPPRAPDTVVLVDELWNKIRVEKRPTAEPTEFYFGCTLAAVKDHAVVQCPARELFVRFRCADLRGPDHAIEFVLRDEGFRLYCR